jgi:hypothetical protein
MKNLPKTEKKAARKPARSKDAQRVDRQLEAAKRDKEELASKTVAPTAEVKAKAPAPKSEDKTLDRVIELRTKFLALHKAKGAPTFKVGKVRDNGARYASVVKLEPAELVKAKEFDGGADVLGFIRWIIGRQEA